MTQDTDVGAAIVAGPEDSNVGKWKEFLARPENLATSLVLLAGITAPRQQGQSKLHQTLRSGVGALGFRGGLEKGIEGSRAAGRDEQRAVAEQDADIAAQAAAAEAVQTNLGINQQLASTQQQIADQNAQPRPLAPSQITLNEAQASALGRTPNAVPDTFNSLFEKNKILFLENNPGMEANLADLALQTNKELLLKQIASEGRITPAGLDITPEEAAVLGIELPADTAPPPASTVDGNTPRTPSSAISPLRTGGRFKTATPANQALTASLLRREGIFEKNDLDENILDEVELKRSLAGNKEALAKLSLEELQDLQSTYSRIFNSKEKALIRKAINARLGLPGSQNLLDKED